MAGLHNGSAVAVEFEGAVSETESRYRFRQRYMLRKDRWREQRMTNELAGQLDDNM